MNDPTPQKIEDLFLDAINVPATQRDQFLRDRCGDDRVLYQKVRDLIAADDAAGGDDFLASAFLAKQVVSPPSIPPSGDAPSDSDRFKILSRYREGGLGEVLIALDRQLNREVAVKQIKPKWQSHHEARERFIQEAEVTGRLEHPGIVPVYAMGTWPDGQHFYAMRLVQGDTFREAIAEHHGASHDHLTPAIARRTRQLGLRQLLGSFIDVCDTISYAHSRQIIHRDIKPSNIIVGPYGETLVVDWGLAKRLDAPLDESVTAAIIDAMQAGDGSTPTRIGGTVGTPQYMSPEQAGGQTDEVGIRTDIYLLGATLYQILAGVAPHRGTTLPTMLSRITAGDFPRPKQIVADVPAALQSICLKAMATDSADRYRSVADLSADVERWLADEPVTVHNDSVTVKVVRWVRRNRTLATAGGVAAALIATGLILGSTLLGALQAKQFRIERENTAKAFALQAASEKRLLELREAARSATASAESEMRAGRYSSALAVCRDSIELLGDAPETEAERGMLIAKADRIDRLVEFYRLAEITNEQNVTSRDSRAIVAGRQSLESLGIWDREDWWNHLPIDDLTPAQADGLAWDVYQQWMLINGMLVKSAGTRLTGPDRKSAAAKLLPAVRRFLRTDAGVAESNAVVAISRRIERFHLSETARWYRKAAEFRLMRGARLAASELGPSMTAVDSHSLAVLSMIAALDPSFELFFHDYRGDDSLMTSRDLFSRAANQRPNHYWTSLGLAQTEFLLARRRIETNRDTDQAVPYDHRVYDAAIAAIGRCIALDPSRPIAYADRSSIYRAKARLIAKMSPDMGIDRDQRVAELNRWSLADAQRAYQNAPTHPWVGWQYGLALHQIGRVDEAVRAFAETSKATLEIVTIEDAEFVRVDDMRGRSEAAEIVESLGANEPNDPTFPSLLASIRLNQDRDEEAAAAAAKALAMDAAPATAHVVAGRLLIPREHDDIDAAMAALDRLRTAKRLDPTHPWIDEGIGRCLEKLGRYAAALAAYETAIEVAANDGQRAAAMLGIARTRAWTQRYQQANQAIDRARELEPACDLNAVIRPLGLHYGRLQKVAPEDTSLPELKRFLQPLIKRPRTTEFAVPSTPSPTFRAALRNGSFELTAARYWDISGSARSETDFTTDGQRSMRLAGRDASLSQAFPVDPDTDYQIRMSVRGPQVSVMVNERSVPVELSPPDENSWQRIDGRFRSLANRRGEIVDATMTIQGGDDGDVWVDDVQVWGTKKNF